MLKINYCCNECCIDCGRVVLIADLDSTCNFSAVWSYDRSFLPCHCVQIVSP